MSETQHRDPEREVQREILRACERVHQRVGQDLHDQLGQMLAGVSLRSERLARRMAKEDSPGAEELNDILGHLRDAITWVRLVSSELCPIALQDGDLVAALEQLCSSSGQREEIRCIFRRPRHDLRVNAAVSRHVYRIAQEALRNAIESDGVCEIIFTVSEERGRLILEIQDDGPGYDPASPEGLGLPTMRYRSTEIGGVFEIGANSEGGTTVRIEAPMSAQV